MTAEKIFRVKVMFFCLFLRGCLGLGLCFGRYLSWFCGAHECCFA